MKSLLNHLRPNRSARRSLSLSEDPIVRLRTQFPDVPDLHLRIYQSVHELTMTSPERVFALCSAAEYIIENQIEGDCVECGVWRGGSMAATAQVLVQSGEMNRRLWMYDTFEGMSEPSKEDVDLRGQVAKQLLDDQDRLDEQSIWCFSPLNQVKETMRKTGYDANKIEFVKGKVEDTLLAKTPEKIALLRLDTDWYESTRCEMEHLFPLLVPGGVIIIDDYGHWEGCRRAIDEYVKKNQISLFLNRIDYTGRIGIKSPVVSV